MLWNATEFRRMQRRSLSIRFVSALCQLCIIVRVLSGSFWIFLDDCLLGDELASHPL